MIVLEVSKIFQNLIGLESFGGGKYHKYFNIIAPSLVSVPTFLLTLWTTLNFIWNVKENILVALSSMQSASGFFMMTSLHWSLLINRAYFYSLFEDMQAIVTDSTYDSCGLELAQHREILI